MWKTGFGIAIRIKRIKGGKPTDKETSSTYRHNLVRAVKTAFKWAEDKGYIRQSPVSKVKVPRQYARGMEAYIPPGQVAAGGGNRRR